MPARPSPLPPPAARDHAATHAAGPGAVVVNNPGDLHTGRAGAGAGWSYRMLYPPAALVADVAAQLADAPGAPGGAGRRRGPPRFAAPVLEDPVAAGQLGRLVTALLAGAEPLETHTLFLASSASCSNTSRGPRRRSRAWAPCSGRAAR